MKVNDLALLDCSRRWLYSIKSYFEQVELFCGIFYFINEDALQLKRSFMDDNDLMRLEQKMGCLGVRSVRFAPIDPASIIKTKITIAIPLSK